MLTLLILKAGTKYFRVRTSHDEISFELCPFNKASVFPESQIGDVKSYLCSIKSNGIDAEIRRLLIEEQPYEEK